jgi:hypothetical protein
MSCSIGVLGLNCENWGRGRAGWASSATVRGAVDDAGCTSGTGEDFTSAGAGDFGVNGPSRGSGRAGSALTDGIDTEFASCTMLGTATNDLKTEGFFSAGRKIV